MTQHDHAPPSPPGLPDHDPAGEGLAAPRPGDEEILPHIFALLHERTGHDFRQYKQGTILRRIDRRMRVRRVRDLASYRRLLDEDPEEAARLLQELLIGVTSFFRDRADFAALEDMIVPRLFHGKGAGDEVRAWVAACSTGEEAYSLGILLHEHAAALPAPPPIQVFATDVDARAIQAARTGLYPPGIAEDVPAHRLARHFTLEDKRYKVNPALRDSMLFAEHNLLRDPPFSRVDLVTCRNFLIYLDREHHRQILENFHFALKPGGYLFLGSAESADAAAHLFAPVDVKRRLYQARPAVRPMPAVVAPRGSAAAARNLPLPAAAAPRSRVPSYAELHRRNAARLAPPSILIDGATEILHIAEDAGRFLHHAGGEPTRDIVALVAPELRLALRTAIFQARQGGRPASSAAVPLAGAEPPRALSFAVHPVASDDAGDRKDLLLVQFIEAETAPAAAPAAPAPYDATVLLQLDEELRHARRQLQETLDQADASGAEWRIANEWLHSTVAELRATLEDQARAHEELQSVNEELVTVNAQLRTKVEETAKAHDDLSNLIASTDIATIFLDRQMRIKRYTPRIGDVFNILPGDLGRPLAHLASKLVYPRLIEDAGEVLRTLQPVEREVDGREGHCYIVRIHPYRTTEDRIDGVVMTFFDISGRRSAEQALRRSEERHRAELEGQVRERTAELEASRDLLRATMDASIDMIQVFEAIRDKDGEIVDFRWVLNNHTSERLYGEVRGESLLERNPGVVARGIFDIFRQVVLSGEPRTDEHHYVHEQFNSWFLQSVVKLGDGVATTTKDIGEWKRAQQELLRLRDEVAQARLQESEQALHASEQHLRLAMAAAGMYSWEIDVATETLSLSRNASAIAGFPIGDASLGTLPGIDGLMPNEERERHRDARLRALRGEAEFHEVSQVRHPVSGDPVWIEAHGTTILGPDGTPARVVGVASNITERRRAEEVLRSSEERHAFLLMLADALRPLDDSENIVYTAARVLGEHLGSDRAYYVNIDEERHEFVVERDWHRPGETSHARRYPLDAWTMPWLDNGRTWVVRDVDTDPIMPDEQRPSYRGNGIRAAIVVPLIKGGRLVATFCTNQRLPRDWSETEVGLIEDTAERIWAAIERTKVQAALRDTSERLSLLLESMGEGVVGLTPDRRCMFINKAGAAMLGYAPGELVGTPSQPLFGARLLEAVAEAASARIEDEVLRRKDGTAVPVSCFVSPMVVDGNPAGAVVVFRACGEGFSRPAC